MVIPSQPLEVTRVPQNLLVYAPNLAGNVILPGWSPETGLP